MTKVSAETKAVLKELQEKIVVQYNLKALAHDGSMKSSVFLATYLVACVDILNMMTRDYGIGTTGTKISAQTSDNVELTITREGEPREP